MNYNNAKNKEQSGMLMIPVMRSSKFYTLKSHLLFQFTLVASLSPRISGVRALRACKCRLREDKSSSVGSGTSCPLLLGGAMWQKMSSKCLTASEVKPSTPLNSATGCLGEVLETECAWRRLYSQSVGGVGQRVSELHCLHMPYRNLLLRSGL